MVVERSGSAGAGSVVSWRFGLFLDRDDAQVFVVEGLICWACDGELGVGCGRWWSGEGIGKVLRSGNGCVGGWKVGKLWFTGG